MERITRYLRLKIKDPPMDPRITDWIRPSPEPIIPDSYISLIHYVLAKPEIWTYFVNPFSKFTGQDVEQEASGQNALSHSVCFVGAIGCGYCCGSTPPTTHKPSNQVFNQPNIESSKQCYIQPVCLQLNFNDKPMPSTLGCFKTQ